MAAPDFTFAVTDTPTLDALVPLYTAILSNNKRMPTVSFGDGCTLTQAVAWLQTQHARYKEAVPKSRALLQKMALELAVNIEDTTGP